MSLAAVLNAERIKLTTTRSSLWIAAGVAAVSVGLAVLQGGLASTPLEPERAVLGITVFGVPVLMVLASMTMTAEYRSGMIRTTFMAVPNRGVVLVGKAVVVSLFSAVYAAVIAVVSMLAARWASDFGGGVDAVVSSPAAWRVAGAVGLYAGLAAVLGVAVGALLRAGPGAVAVVLLWPLVVEPVLGNLPEVGPRVGPYLPFANIFLVTEVPWLYPAYAMPWGTGGSLVYFAVTVAAVFGAAVALVTLRDA
ncbi:ABC transporter permease [Mycolicibacterium phlei]|uniref:ABC transporter permease n=1 Tax=Mycolicibacterium phlei TaxID=1771 RepID=UPI00025AF1B7|nr:ABC transporter permease [Mycolicibacterium phlei]EID14568.1 ABC transporter [Mycolicibacterium phlei RIVM601174]MBF4195600.1 ABC transporter [Mycolicibacterium phlei]